MSYLLIQLFPRCIQNVFYFINVFIDTQKEVNACYQETELQGVK